MEAGKDEETKQEGAAPAERQLSELKERLEAVDKQLMTMEWDKAHNQFNSGVEEKYAQLKAEKDALIQKMKGSAA